ncbi:uncharacterized protein LOC125046643 [Penaeus chinensis]|uniref:uncharacterized protein LOC125046643 n=1 Tax=Penaeus chinensis TaxID=139456 RepID=UPI001FB59390|nr:uncharacterized protein LOC125046643 [Penaeus chinensis]XP_047500439.1 uncharacterized protein LOC125046643 [Penaeus chinensis]
MSFSEVRTMGGSVGTGVGMGAANLGHLPVEEVDQAVVPPPPPPVAAPAPPPAVGAPMFSSFQTASLSSSPAGFPPISRPNIGSMWGIGGFTSPALPTPPAVTPNTIASTLGNPQMPSVTFFNSRAPMGFNFRMAGSHLGTPYVYKRKPEDELEEVKPVVKQHITEEKMSAHLNALHLSESYCNHKLGKKGLPSEAELSEDADEGLGHFGEDQEGMLLDAKGPMRLIISDEVKQVVPGESQLPASLLKKLTQPSMEVVLWRPPGDVIRNIISTNVGLEDKNGETNTSEPVDSSDSASTSSSAPAAAAAAAAPDSAQRGETSASSSPDSGISVSSPPPSLSFLGQQSSLVSPFTSAGSVSAEAGDDLLSLPSTSSGSRGGGYLPPLRRPASPLPDPMADDDFSERMEFNNNNGNAPNFMWLEENNNSALIDLNAVEPQRAPLLDDLPDLPDSDDMDL